MKLCFEHLHYSFLSSASIFFLPLFLFSVLSISISSDYESYDWDDDSVSYSEDFTSNVTEISVSPSLSPLFLNVSEGDGTIDQHPKPVSPLNVVQLKNRISCDSAKEASGLILKFTYSIETTKDVNELIEIMERSLTNELAEELLKCENRRLYEGVRRGNEKKNPVMNIVAIDSFPRDKKSDTRGCLPVLDKNNVCHVIEGALTISFGYDTDLRDIEYAFLSRIMYYMVNGLFIGHIPGIARLAYREPSFAEPSSMKELPYEIQPKTEYLTISRFLGLIGMGTMCTLISVFMFNRWNVINDARGRDDASRTLRRNRHRRHRHRADVQPDSCGPRKPPCHSTRHHKRQKLKKARSSTRGLSQKGSKCILSKQSTPCAGLLCFDSPFKINSLLAHGDLSVISEERSNWDDESSSTLRSTGVLTLRSTGETPLPSFVEEESGSITESSSADKDEEDFYVDDGMRYLELQPNLLETGESMRNSEGSGLLEVNGSLVPIKCTLALV